jgi:transposase-like protein
MAEEKKSVDELLDRLLEGKAPEEIPGNDLRTLYSAPRLEAAEQALETFGQTWGEVTPLISRQWRTHWGQLTPFFDYHRRSGR